jgi:hypothetical protein
MSKKY